MQREYSQNEYSGPDSRQDIVIRGENEALLINVAVPADTNILKKEVEKFLKYRSLAIEIGSMSKSSSVEILPTIHRQI